MGLLEDIGEVKEEKNPLLRDIEVEGSAPLSKIQETPVSELVPVLPTAKPEEIEPYRDPTPEMVTPPTPTTPTIAAVKSFFSKTPGQLQALVEGITPATQAERQRAKEEPQRTAAYWEFVEDVKATGDQLDKMSAAGHEGTPEFKQLAGEYADMLWQQSQMQKESADLYEPRASAYDYWRTAGINYPKVTAENKKELQGKLTDSETPKEERAKIAVALQMDLVPMSEQDRQELLKLQEKSNLDNSSLWDAAEASFTLNLPSLLKTAGVVTAPTLFYDMYEEQHRTAKQKAEEQDLTYNPENSQNIDRALIGAALNSGLEVAANSVSLNALSGKPLGNILNKALSSLENSGLGGRALAYLTKALGSAQVEGITEGTQQIITEAMTEATLVQQAESEGVEYQPKPYEEIAEDIKQAYQSGVLVGGFSSAIGTPVAAVQGIKPVETETTQNKQIKKDLNTTKELGLKAVAKTDADFLTEIEAMSVDSLFTAANSIGYPAGPVSRDSLTQFLLENKDRNKQYQKFLYQNFEQELSKTELSAFDKDVVRWLAQGDISTEEIGMLRTLSDTILQEQDGIYKTTEDLWAGMSERNPDKAVKELYVEGPETKTGAKTLRGRTSVTGEGKFILDLFTRGDMTVLGREFIQVLSTQLQPEVMQEVIGQAVDSKYGHLDKKSRTDFKVKAQRAWNLFQQDPASPRFGTDTREYMVLFKDVQDFLGDQFTAYITNPNNAPTHKLYPVFRRLRKISKRYYKDVRGLPYKQQRVIPETAKLFDQALAGENALVRPLSFASVIDGKSRSIKVSEATQEARNILKRHLARAGAEITGLKGQVIDYADTALDAEARKDTTLQLLIEKISNKASATKSMERVDKLLFQSQRRVQNKIIKEIQKLMSSRNLEGLPKDLQKSLKSMFSDINLRTMSPKKTSELEGLRSALQKQINQGKISQDILSVPQQKFLAIKRLGNMDIHELSQEELQGLHDTIHQAVAEELRKQEYRVGKYLRELDQDSNQLDAELESNPFYKPKRSKRTIRQERFDNVVQSATKKLVTAGLAPIRRLRALDSKILDTVQGGLVEGHKTTLMKRKEYRNFLNSAVSGQDVKSGSTFLSGGLKGVTQNYNVKVESVQLDKSGKPIKGAKPKLITVPMTEAQLMYLYGISFEEAGMSHILNGGVVYPGREDQAYKFTSRESFYSLIESLPESKKQIVRDTMGFYRGISKDINEISNRRWGKPIAEVENYIPLYIEWMDRGGAGTLTMNNLRPEVKQFVQKFVDASSFLQTRKGGDNPVYAVDFYEGISKNLLDVSHFIGMSDPISYARAMMFGQKPHGNYDKLKTLLGERGIKQLEDWINNIEDPSIKQAPYWKDIVAMNQTVKRGIIAANVPIALYQMASAPLGANYFSEGSVAKAMTQNIADPQRNIFKLSNSIQEMGELSPLMWERFSSDPTVLSNAVDFKPKAAAMWQEPTKLRGDWAAADTPLDIWKVIRRLDVEGGMKIIRMRDAWAISTLLDAARIEGEKRGWSEDKVVAEWEKVVERTQPMNDPIFSSSFLGDRSAASKLLITPFMSMRDQLNGETYENIQKIRYAKAKGEKAPRKAIENILRVEVVNSILIAIISSAWKFAGDDEATEGDISKHVAVKSVINTVSRLPVIGGILTSGIQSLLYGWDADPSGVIVAEKLGELTNEIVDVIETSSKGEDITEKLISAATTAASLTGSSAKNVETTIEKASKIIGEE